MSPESRKLHQLVLIELMGACWSHLKGKACQFFAATFDVRPLATSEMSDDDVDTVVQPDLLVVCDRNKLEERGVVGAPDLVVEILSPNTARKDLSKKFDLYERAGVLEYWIIYPIEKIIHVYRLEDGRYGSPYCTASKKTVEVPWLDNFSLDVAAVFAE